MPSHKNQGKELAVNWNLATEQIGHTSSTHDTAHRCQKEEITIICEMKGGFHATINASTSKDAIFYACGSDDISPHVCLFPELFASVLPRFSLLILKLE